jgi:hypothetical protein
VPLTRMELRRKARLFVLPCALTASATSELFLTGPDTTPPMKILGAVLFTLFSLMAIAAWAGAIISLRGRKASRWTGPTF